jgi:hypothetical protein
MMTHLLIQLTDTDSENETLYWQTSDNGLTVLELDLLHLSSTGLHRVSPKDDTLCHWQFSSFFPCNCAAAEEETYRLQNYHHYLDILDEWFLPLPDISIQEMYLFLSFILQMGDNQRNTLKMYWLTWEQILQPFMEKQWQERFFFHIMRFPHFSGNNENWNCNMKTILDMLTDVYAKCYSWTEH